MGTLPFQNDEEQQGNTLTTAATMILSIVLRWFLFLACPFGCMLHPSFFFLQKWPFDCQIKNYKTFQPYL